MATSESRGRSSVGRCVWTQSLSDRVRPVTYPEVDWLGRPKGQATAYVLPEHSEDFLRFTSYRRRYLCVFHLLMAILALTLLATAILDMVRVLGSALLIVALVMWVFPFATPATMEHLGIKRSMATVRFGVIPVTAFGIWYFLDLGAGP